MKLKYILSITDARKKIFQIVQAIQKPNTHFTLTQNGRPKAVIMSADEYDSLIETLEVLSDPECVKAIQEHEKNKAEGKEDYVSLEEVLKEEGYYDKIQSKSGKAAKKSSKKN